MKNHPKTPPVPSGNHPSRPNHPNPIQTGSPKVSFFLNKKNYFFRSSENPLKGELPYISGFHMKIREVRCN